MIRFQDFYGRIIKLSEERLQHLESHHPEMLNQIERIRETLLQPDEVVGTLVDPTVELFHRFYEVTPVTSKFLGVTVKVLPKVNFVLTAH
jgi:hypothetical protein